MTEETRVTDPNTGGQKGKKLERFDLIPWDALEVVAKLYGKGAEKYAERNWERGYAWSLSFGALHRHLKAWWGGEDRDAETGLPHLAAVAWHALGLLAFSLRKKGTDDRPQAPKRPTLIYVAHPLGKGTDRVKNRAKAARWVGAIAKLPHVLPIAPWITIAESWDESHREQGLALDFWTIEACDVVWLVGGHVSPGMALEREFAESRGIPVRDLTNLGSEPPEAIS